MISQQDNEELKYQKDNDIYFNYIAELEKLNPPTKEIVYNFPIFVGQVNMARMLFLYELYKKVINLSGNIAEIGTYKGATFLLWAKLIKLFEPYNPTRVFGFDWFKGMETGSNDNKENNGLYKADYEMLKKLISLQNLNDVAILEKMDVTKEISDYIQERPYLRFKIIFIDCGIEKVMEATLKALWPKLVKGGILIMDHYGLLSSPTESNIVDKYVGNREICQMPFSRQPSGYIIK